MAELTADSPLFEVVKVEQDRTAMARQRLATFKVHGDQLDPENPVVAFRPGDVGLVRIDAALLIPIGSFSQGAWNGDKKDPAIRFDTYPEGDFTVGILVWGLSY